MAEALAACQVGEHAARLTPMKRGQCDVEDDLEEGELGRQRGSSTKKRKTPVRPSSSERQLEEDAHADGHVLDVERDSSSSSSSFTEKRDRGVDVEQRVKGDAEDKGVPWALGVAGLKHTTSTSREREECEEGLSSSPVEISDVRSLWKAREEVARSGGTTMEMSVCSSIAWVSPRTKRLTMGEAAEPSSSSPKIVSFDRPGGWISPRQKRRSSSSADSTWNMTVKVADGLGFWDAPPIAVSRGKDKSHGLLVSGAIEDGGGAFLSASISGGAAEDDGGEGRGESHASVQGSICKDSSLVLEVVGGEHQQQHLETISLAVVGTNDDASSSLRKGCEEQLSSSGSSIVQVPLKYRAVEAAKGIRTAAMTLQLNKQPPRHVPEIASPGVRVLEHGGMDSASSSPIMSSPSICCGTPMSRGTPMSLASPCVQDAVDSSVADSVAEDKSISESPGAFFRSLLVQEKAGKRGGKRTGLRTSFSRRRGRNDVQSVENGGVRAAAASAPSPSALGVVDTRPPLFSSLMPAKEVASLGDAAPGVESSAAASFAESEHQAAVDAVSPGDSNLKLSCKAPQGDCGRKADFTPKRPRSVEEATTDETPKRRRGDMDADVDGLLGGVSTLNLQSSSPVVAACAEQENGTQRSGRDAVSTPGGQVAGDGEAVAVPNSPVAAVEEVQETAGENGNGRCNDNVAYQEEKADSIQGFACDPAVLVDLGLASSSEVEASSSSSSSAEAAAVVVDVGAEERGLAPSAETLVAAAGCESASSTGASTVGMVDKEISEKVGTPMGNKWEGCAVEMLLETLDTLASAMSPYPANSNNGATLAASASNAPIVASSTPRPSAAPVSATKFLPRPSPSVASTPTAASTIKAQKSAAKADAPGSATLRPVKQSPFDGKRVVGDDDDLPRPTFEVLKVLEGEGMAPPPRIELMIGGNGDSGGGAGVGWVSPRTKKLQGGDLSKGGSGQVVKKGLRVLRESAMNTRRGCR